MSQFRNEQNASVGSSVRPYRQHLAKSPLKARRMSGVGATNQTLPSVSAMKSRNPNSLSIIEKYPHRSIEFIESMRKSLRKNLPNVLTPLTQGKKMTKPDLHWKVLCTPRTDSSRRLPLSKVAADNVALRARSRIFSGRTPTTTKQR